MPAKIGPALSLALIVATVTGDDFRLPANAAAELTTDGTRVAVELAAADTLVAAVGPWSRT